MKRLIVLLLITFAATVVHAADVKLAWDANIEPEVMGYRLHWGVVNEIPFTEAVDVSNVTEYTLSGLVEDQTYYFAVTAYSLESESGYSNIVQYIPRPGRVIIRILDRPKSIRAVFE